MKTYNITQNNKFESDQLLLKIFRMIPLFVALNLIIVLLTHNGRFNILDWCIASAIIFCLIPLTYYKYSKERTYFVFISLLCIECTASVIYMRSWFYASLLWSFSLIVCTLYLNVSLIKRLLVIKLPIFILVNYLTLQVKSDYVFKATTKTFISSCAYFILQFMIIGYLCIYLAKKTTRVFENFIEQNNQLDILLSKNQASTSEINETINHLTYNIDKSSIGLEAIATSSTSISNKAFNTSTKALECKTAFHSILEQIGETSTKSIQVHELTEQMSTLTIKNKDNMQSLTHEMQNLRHTNIQSKNDFQILQESTLEISNALKIINDVADETNLLSLNASIEAAKAGESGKGFAVVATEIKKLADQSAHSARYIEAVIGKVTLNTANSLNTVNHTDQLIEHNLDSLQIALKDFDKMVNFQDTVSHKISESQALIHTLSQHIRLLDGIINETLLDSQDTSSSIHEISSILEELNLTFHTISDDAKQVQNYSNHLVEAQTTAINTNLKEEYHD